MRACECARNARVVHAHKPAGATRRCRFRCTACPYPCPCRCCAARPTGAGTWRVTTTSSLGVSATGCSRPTVSIRPTPSAASAYRRSAWWWTLQPSRWATSSMPSSRSASASAGAPPAPRRHRICTASAPHLHCARTAFVPPLTPTPHLHQAHHLLGDPGGRRGRSLPRRPDMRGPRPRGRRGGGQVRCLTPALCGRRCRCTRCSSRQVVPARCARCLPTHPHGTQRARPYTCYTCCTHSADRAGTRGTAAWR